MSSQGGLAMAADRAQPQAPAAPAGGRSRFNATGVLTTLLLVSVVYGLFRFAGKWPAAEDWRAFVAAQSALSFALFAGLVCIATMLRGWRWHFLLGDQAPGPRGTVVLAIPWFFLLKSLSPFRAGDLMRPVWVMRRGGSFSYALGTVAAERALDLVVLAGLLLSSLGALRTQMDAAQAPAMIAIIVVLYGLALMLAGWIERTCESLRERLAWRGGSLAKLGRLAGAASQVARAFRFL